MRAQIPTYVPHRVGVRKLRSESLRLRRLQGASSTGRMRGFQPRRRGFESHRSRAWVATGPLCRRHLARHLESAGAEGAQAGNNCSPGGPPRKTGVIGYRSRLLTCPPLGVWGFESLVFRSVEGRRQSHLRSSGPLAAREGCDPATFAPLASTMGQTHAMFQGSHAWPSAPRKALLEWPATGLENRSGCKSPGVRTLCFPLGPASSAGRARPW